MTHTDQSRELLPCPFCGGGITSIRENGRVWTGTHYSEPSSVSVNHHCEPIEGQPSRSIERVGRDDASAIAAWNRRAATEQPSGVELPEPVTWLIERHAFSVSPHGQDAEGHSWIEEAHGPGEQGSFAVYTEQQVRALLAGVKDSLTVAPAVPQGWIAVGERLPEPGRPVLLDIGKKHPIRAMWAARFTLEAGDDDPDWGEYDEDGDMYYCPQGWYEWNEHEDTHWRVHADPIRWAELPQPPKEQT